LLVPPKTKAKEEAVAVEKNVQEDIIPKKVEIVMVLKLRMESKFLKLL